MMRDRQQPVLGCKTDAPIYGQLAEYHPQQGPGMPLQGTKRHWDIIELVGDFKLIMSFGLATG